MSRNPAFGTSFLIAFLKYFPLLLKISPEFLLKTDQLQRKKPDAK